MYNISNYSAMINDATRVNGFHRAIELAVKPGSVVVDIGTGLGIFAFLACKAGARKVYAIEPSTVTALAKQLAVVNGCADRIEFITDLSTRISLPEPADVIVSDIAGAVPLFQGSVPTLIDARTRFLRPGGVMIPQTDVIWAAIVEAPDVHSRFVPSIDRELGLDMALAWRTATNVSSNRSFNSDQLITAAQRFVTLDYATVEDPNCRADLTWTVDRAGTGHGFDLWFDRTLVDGVCFSTHPGPEKRIYGSLFLPWSEAVPLEVGDLIAATLRADITGGDYTWSWSTRITRGGDVVRQFRQSDFLGDAYSPDRLRKQATNFRPALNEDGQIERLILELMDGQSSVEEIARKVQQQFPRQFPTLEHSISRVGQLSRSYSA